MPARRGFGVVYPYCLPVHNKTGLVSYIHTVYMHIQERGRGMDRRKRSRRRHPHLPTGDSRRARPSGERLPSIIILYIIIFESCIIIIIFESCDGRTSAGSPVGGKASKHSLIHSFPEINCRFSVASRVRTVAAGIPRRANLGGAPPAEIREIIIVNYYQCYYYYGRHPPSAGTSRRANLGGASPRVCVCARAGERAGASESVSRVSGNARAARAVAISPQTPRLVCAVRARDRALPP